MNKNTLVNIIGYPATILHGDTAVFDRWIWLKKNLKRGPLRTLDAGCGSGAFTLYAAKIGNEAVGISFDERNNNVARERAEILGLKNIKFIQGDLRRLNEMKDIGVFDQIICFETIEHILNDQKLLKDIFKILNPEGKLILTAPYKYYNKHFLGDDKTSLSVYEDGGHVRWGYTHDEISKLFEGVGFILEKKEYVSGIISQFLIKLDRVIGLATDFRLAWIIIFPLRILIVFDKFLTKVFNYPHLSVAVIAKKEK